MEVNPQRMNCLGTLQGRGANPLRRIKPTLRAVELPAPFLRFLEAHAKMSCRFSRLKLLAVGRFSDVVVSGGMYSVRSICLRNSDPRLRGWPPAKRQGAITGPMPPVASLSLRGVLRRDRVIRAADWGGILFAA